MPSQHKPEAPRSWQGRFIAIYPDGTQSDFDSGDSILRAGEPVGDTGWILDRFEVMDEQIEGKWLLAGYMRPSEAGLSAEDKAMIGWSRCLLRSLVRWSEARCSSLPFVIAETLVRTLSGFLGWVASGDRTRRVAQFGFFVLLAGFILQASVNFLQS